MTDLTHRLLACKARLNMSIENALYINSLPLPLDNLLVAVANIVFAYI